MDLDGKRVEAAQQRRRHDAGRSLRVDGQGARQLIVGQRLVDALLLLEHGEVGLRGVVARRPPLHDALPQRSGRRVKVDDREGNAQLRGEIAKEVALPARQAGGVDDGDAIAGRDLAREVARLKVGRARRFGRVEAAGQPGAAAD